MPKSSSSILIPIAKAISLVSHPGLLPCWIIFLWFPWSGSFLRLQLFTLFFLGLLPVLATWIYFRSKGLTDMFVILRKDRIVPFFFNLVGILILSLANVLILEEIIPMKYVYMLLLFNGSGLLITFYWKISLHMIGMGALIGGIWALQALPENALMITGIFAFWRMVAWARFYLKSHDWKQLVAGAVLGIAGAWGLVAVL